MEIKVITQASLSPEEKKRQLYLKQKKLLDLFLARNAISRQEYDNGIKYLCDQTDGNLFADIFEE